MGKFGEWKRVQRVTEWQPQGKAVWEVNVLVPGDYQADLTYAGNGRLVWMMGCVTSDILPTLVDILANVERGLPQDGMDILPALKGEMKERDKPIGFAYGQQSTWMTYRYKFIAQTNENKTVCELYDLLLDPYETTDIHSQNPETVKNMLNELSTWIQSCNDKCGQ